MIYLMIKTTMEISVAVTSFLFFILIFLFKTFSLSNHISASTKVIKLIKLQTIYGTNWPLSVGTPEKKTPSFTRFF